MAADPAAKSGVTARRALAYTRSRAALAEGPTWAGWQASKLARTALAAARQDTDRGHPGERFLDELAGRLDAVFMGGHEPARPRPAPAKPARGKRKRSHRR